jgi:hypothetical protein
MGDVALTVRVHQSFDKKIQDLHLRLSLPGSGIGRALPTESTF